MSRIQNTAVSLLATVLLLAWGSTVQALECKTLSRNQCIQSAQCSWIKGYVRKDGKRVSPYCRKKPSVHRKTTGKKNVKKARSKTTAPKSSHATSRSNATTRTKSKIKGGSQSKAGSLSRKKVGSSTVSAGAARLTRP